jgi:phosphonate transport system ATP-binding protein
LLEIKNLTMIYDGGVEALHDVSFTVRDGEFVALIGLSGAGKSTLLRCINRLVEPTEGQIVFDGEDITAASPQQLRMIRRSIGMIFQQFNLVERSKVITNVLSGRLGYVNAGKSLVGIFPREETERAMANLERVGIPDKAQSRADELSGGQQQRVGIARALMQEPKLMLADEPVASLDPVLSDSILMYLEELNKKEDVTVICSLHIPALARRYGTRIIALKDGRLVFDGSTEEFDDDRFEKIYGVKAEGVAIA